MDTLEAIYVGNYACEIPLVHNYAHRYNVAADLLRSESALAQRLRPAGLATSEDFHLAHEATYAAALAATAAGTETRYPRVPLVFEQQGLGGTLATVRHCLATGGTAYHLGGGFHHARWSQPGSIDFVNDIAAALVTISRALPEARILHLDVDAHAPDGLHEILARGVCTGVEIDSISLHMEELTPTTTPDSLDAGVPWNIGLRSGCTNDEYLQQLGQVVDVVVARSDYAFVLVQAGVDPLVGDPTANLALDDHGLYARDVVIADLITTLACPAAVILGGGHAGAASGRAACNTVRALAGLDMHEES